MRAFTFAEAIQLALADVETRDRKRRRLKPFFTKADRITHSPDWVPWWDLGPAGTRVVEGRGPSRWDREAD